ncbi:hypothetical protein ABZ714_25330 [Streptomyces sp. NPDC006798]|uniref:hypothetical protein n=1 Tax=Streptomyces sp. NPDC006798 TaxID=3155462 RepID=UPI0033ED6039
MPLLSPELALFIVSLGFIGSIGFRPPGGVVTRLSAAALRSTGAAAGRGGGGTEP